MEEYYFKTWETINVFTNAYQDFTTSFLILDGFVDVDADEDPSNPPPGINIIYSGVRSEITNRFKNLENILSPKLTMQLFWETPNMGWSDEYKKTFYIYQTTNDWLTTDYPVSIEVQYDWSYIPNWPYMSELSNPIEYKVDPRQYFVWTSRQLVPGTTNRQQLYINDIASPDWFTTMLYDNLNYHCRYQVGDLAGYTPGNTIRINNNQNSVVVEPCKDYCLYYTNQFGGWDWLLVNGTSLKIDKLSRLSYKSNYEAQASTPGTRNKITYNTIINENWELNTSWLTDIQSSKMSNLLESNQVVLHDLKNNYLIPVLITNSNVEYKTYKNQGRKLYSYKIEVEASKPKYRL